MWSDYGINCGGKRKAQRAHTRTHTHTHAHTQQLPARKVSDLIKSAAAGDTFFFSFCSMNGEGGGGGVVVCASLVARRSDADPVDRFRHFSVSVGLAARFPQEEKQ